MIEVNGKKYKLNADICLGTEKLISKIIKDPENIKNITYMEIVLRDILIPIPTVQELDKFRRSDRERIFEAFGNMVETVSTDFKKKRSLL